METERENEPTEEEVQEARREIMEAGAAARERLRKQEEMPEQELGALLLDRVRMPGTLLMTMVDLILAERAYTLSFVIEHVHKRAVLRDDVATDAVKQVAPTWRGTWQPVSYAKGALVNDRSALWVSERPTAARPGSPDSGWKLCIKSPR